MKIKVIEIPNCTWELEDDTFYCTHDEFTVETFEVDTMRNGEHDTYETQGYVCADPDCEEVLEGSPEEDAIDEDWEYERMRDYEDDRSY